MEHSFTEGGGRGERGEGGREREFYYTSIMYTDVKACTNFVQSCVYYDYTRNLSYCIATSVSFSVTLKQQMIIVDIQV